MDEPEQETMDGSPAHVGVTLDNLARTGKFSADAYAAMQPADLGTVVIGIKFQAGPIGEVGVNGCSIEDVIDVLVARLDGFQRGPFQCQENAEALTHLLDAKRWLLLRTERRQSQGVEGTNAPHRSG